MRSGVVAAAEALELVVAGAVVPAQVAGRGYTVAEMIEDYRKLRAADLSPVMRGAFCHTR